MPVPTTPDWRRHWRKLCGVGSERGVASEKLTEWEQLCGEFWRLKSEVQGLLESISPADKALDLALKNGNNCA